MLIINYTNMWLLFNFWRVNKTLFCLQNVFRSKYSFSKIITKIISTVGLPLLWSRFAPPWCHRWPGHYWCSPCYPQAQCGYQVRNHHSWRTESRRYDSYYFFNIYSSKYTCINFYIKNRQTVLQFVGDSAALILIQSLLCSNCITN